jgi:hypothetical protein
VNNISTCLAQQTPSPASFSSEPPPPRAVLVEYARQWANKALAQAAAIAPPERDEDCDVGCAVATHNLGEFYEMDGKINEARQKYEEAASLAKAVGFAEGQVNAKAGLARLKALENQQR